MSDEKIINTNPKDVSINHLCYVGSVLTESIKNFRSDLLDNLDKLNNLDKPVSVIISRPPFLKMMELTEIFEQAIKLYFTLS